MTPDLRQKLLETAVQQTNKTVPTKKRTPNKKEKGKALTQTVERFHLFLKCLNEEGVENLLSILRGTPQLIGKYWKRQPTHALRCSRI